VVAKATAARRHLPRRLRDLKSVFFTGTPWLGPALRQAARLLASLLERGFLTWKARRESPDKRPTRVGGPAGRRLGGAGGG
jgi:hypothetical protein